MAYRHDTRRSEPHVEQPFPRYESTSQRFWRDLRMAQKFRSDRS